QVQDCALCERGHSGILDRQPRSKPLRDPPRSRAHRLSHDDEPQARRLPLPPGQTRRRRPRRRPPPVSVPRSIPEAFLASAARHPDKPCLLFEGRTHTYADLRTASFRWVEAFRAWGLVDGDRVALFLENSPTFVAAYLGIQLA